MKTMSKVAVTKAVGGAVVLLILAVGYLLVLAPRLSAEDDIEAQTETAEQNNAVVSQTIADLEAKEAALDDQREVAAALARRFPPRAVQSDMFADVRVAAERAGIADDDVTTLTPTAPAAAGSVGATGGATLPESGDAPTAGLATMQLTASVTGTREQLQDFLAAMEDRDRSYLFQTAGLSPAGEEGGAAAASSAYTLGFTGTMFLLPVVPDPDDPPAPTDAAATAP